MAYLIFKWVLAFACSLIGIVAIVAPSPYRGTSIFGIFLVMLGLSLVPNVRNWVGKKSFSLLTGRYKGIAWCAVVIGLLALIPDEKPKPTPMTKEEIAQQQEEERRLAATQASNQSECKKILRAFLEMRTDLEISGFAYHYKDRVYKLSADDRDGGCRQFALGLGELSKPYQGTPIPPSEIEYALRKVSNARSLLGE